MTNNIIDENSNGRSLLRTLLLIGMVIFVRREVTNPFSLTFITMVLVIIGGMWVAKWMADVKKNRDP
ncbi:hypothetical protein [Pseudochryseolinea flava]|uniref:Uncharacterized protein n=1 Tax=Pseudochryseolinea flava TaxID=2059302 RepID=A0A364Y543_9BACT|nr:hypothetical protein [Pseudochryseolinea flava]RAW02118.1 hypothetical protein DQQ10_06105 [Pseudochryseolinea flava]